MKAKKKVGQGQEVLSNSNIKNTEWLMSDAVKSIYDLEDGWILCVMSYIIPCYVMLWLIFLDDNLV
jgi:hypothetical protein